MLYLVFFASGVSGLLLETLWFYQSGLALGNSYWGATVVLSAFMGGLALGNLTAMRWAMARMKSIRIYAFLEVIIAVAGPLLVLLLPVLGKAIAPLAGLVLDHPALVNPIRFVAAFFALMIPSTAMGMTLPMMTQALAREELGFREILGKLYGLNTLGAVAGTLLGELLLIACLGIIGTAFVAGGLNLSAAAGAWWLSRRFNPDPIQLEVHRWKDLFPPNLGLCWISIAMSGFLLLALEVVWVRFLTLYVTMDSLSFALMLAIVLAGIAFGGLAASILPKRFPWLSRSVSSVLFFSGALCTLSYVSFSFFFKPFGNSALTLVSHILRVAVPLMFPVSFLSGAFFTLAGASIRPSFRSSRVSAGALTLFNTVGAALGAVTAGFWLIPSVGVEYTLFLVSLLYGIAGAVWWFKSREPSRPLLAGVAPWVVSLLLFPFGTMQNHHLPLAASRWFYLPGFSLASSREGLTETILYIEKREFDRPLYYQMVTGSLTMAGNRLNSRRYMQEFVYLPLAFQAHPQKALLICFGVGSTAKALTDSKQLESIDVVDVSRDVLDMSRIIFPDPATHPLSDPRVKVHVEDGRYFLQASRQKFDLITGEPPPPNVPNVASLYSKEYFQLVRDHLSEGGMVSYWLPIHSLSEEASCAILRAFSEVFPTCFLWHGSALNLVMLGINGALPLVTEEGFVRQWRDPIVAPELARLGFESPAQLGCGFVGDGDYIRKITAAVLPLVDNYPKRILAKGTSGQALYGSWYDSDSARARFKACAETKQLIPAAWYDQTLSGFDTEFLITTMGQSSWINNFPDFSHVHSISSRTSLIAPVLWMLGSDGDIQRLVDRIPEQSRNTPEIHYHQGVRYLAERNYQKAADHLIAALPQPTMQRTTLATCLYVLCMADRRQEAEGILERMKDLPHTKQIPQSYWTWIQQEFTFSIPESLRKKS